MVPSMYLHPQDPKGNIGSSVEKCMIYRQPDILEGSEKLLLGVLPASVCEGKVVGLNLHHQRNISCLQCLLLLQDGFEIFLVLIAFQSTKGRTWIVFVLTQQAFFGNTYLVKLLDLGEY